MNAIARPQAVQDGRSRLKVVVPFAPGRLHPVTAAVLRSYHLPVEFAELGDEDAYRRLLRRLWDEGETVVLIEHDVVPWPGAIEELHGCSGQWCSCSYRIRGGYGIYHGLGCTKISHDLMRATPDLWREPQRWDVLDQVLFFAARDVGQEPHHHRPSVLHLSPAEIGPT